ncbi:MAG: tRNA (adenosine(37)-N6)-threonylcarbamoyltransferase complex dimerization subunit type 1 TsaB [Lachnospiraceae bacterium]|nr:tRNA (adenosine(37)-N6)-threonylcarbamoyltransferase complex dimerization subunit type 1 TsaB [Lachnospiraceae bacterium]
MLTIGIDSSGLVAGAAIIKDGVLLAEYTTQYKKTHSQTLLPMLAEICRMTDTDIAEADCFAVTEGPGSFTGLRIGSATVKGLALVTGKPVAGVPTVDAIAADLWGCTGLVVPLMDARRDQVYTGIYTFESAGEGMSMRTIMSQRPMDITDLVERLNSETGVIYFLGDGVPRYLDRIRSLLDRPYHVAPAGMNRQRASCVAVLGEQYLREGRAVSGFEHKPVYLRPSQAERERNEKLGHPSGGI